MLFKKKTNLGVFLVCLAAVMCEMCFPIASVVFDYLFNGNVLSPIQWVSALVMLVAIYKISSKQEPEIEITRKSPRLCEVS